MPIVVTPEVGIPLPFDVTPEEAEGFRERRVSEKVREEVRERKNKREDGRGAVIENDN